MRPLTLALSLTLAALVLTGCARPWSNPDVPDSKQAEYQFDKDSTDCGIIASEQYPLDKNKQLPVYEACMQDRGWSQKAREDGIIIRQK